MSRLGFVLVAQKLVVSSSRRRCYNTGTIFESQGPFCFQTSTHPSNPSTELYQDPIWWGMEHFQNVCRSSKSCAVTSQVELGYTASSPSFVAKGLPHSYFLWWEMFYWILFCPVVCGSRIFSGDSFCLGYFHDIALLSHNVQGIQHTLERLPRCTLNFRGSRCFCKSGKSLCLHSPLVLNSYR